MSYEWPLKKLQAVAREVTVGYVGSMASEYVESGVPFLRSLNIDAFAINTNDLKFITKEFHQRLKKSALQPGDVAIVRTGKPGTCSVIPDWLTEANCSDLVIVRCGEEIRPHFLCYWVNSKASHHIESHTVGAVQQHFNVGSAKTMDVAVPSLDEQDKVLEILCGIDNRITLLRETNTTLEAIAQALFKSWFVDFDPVHAKMQGRAPEGMDEATAALFPDSFEESELGSVPKGWRAFAVGELLVPKRGKSITKSKCIDGDIPVVAGGLEPAYFHNQSNVSHPVITVSASGANAGFVRLYQQDIWASDCSFVSKEQTDNIYFWYVFLKSNQDSIYFMQQGAAQPHIYPSDLMRLRICAPKSNDLRNLFHNIVLPFFERIGISNAKIQTLSKLRDTLLPRLISGQLRIEEVQEAIA